MTDLALINNIKYNLFKLSNTYNDSNILEYYDYYNSLIDDLGLDNYINGCKILNNIYHKRKRLKDRISKMFAYSIVYDDYKLYFLTFTFNDDSLNNLLSSTRSRYIRNYLNDQNVLDYVGNIDFGKINHREHYHFIVLTNSKLDFNKYSLGLMNCKYINSCNDFKLSKYLVKLSNHAFKSTTNCKCIYKRLKGLY